MSHVSRGASSTRAEHGGDLPAHQALFYRGDDDYIDGVLRFITPGLEAGEPIAVAVPGPRAALLRERLDTLRADIEMLDMFELGRNPGRIIPAVQGMLSKHGGRLLHYVGEPIWPGRSPEEIREATRHEALINLAWPGAEIRVLCPYDAEALEDSVLADAERTHSWVIREGQGSASPSYAATVPLTSEAPLQDPPAHATALHFEARGPGAGPRAGGRTRRGGRLCPRERADDLILAANEVATNTVKHAQGTGRLRVWSTAATVVCQFRGPRPHRGPTPRPGAAPTPSVDGGPRAVDGQPALRPGRGPHLGARDDDPPAHEPALTLLHEKVA